MLLLVVLASADFANQQRLYNAAPPLIGITGLDLPQYRNTTTSSAYFPKSYTKWLEQHGIDWAPIYVYEDAAAIDEKLRHMSGLLLTGGGQPIKFTSTNQRESPFRGCALRN